MKRNLAIFLLLFLSAGIFSQTIARLLGFHFTANHPVGEPVKTVLP